MKNGVNFQHLLESTFQDDHILSDEENLERIQTKIQKAKNLLLLLETSV